MFLGFCLEATQVAKGPETYLFYIICSVHTKFIYKTKVNL